MRQRENAAGFLRQLGELLRLLQRRRERLVADDVDAALQECLRDLEVHVVRRDDGDRLYAVLQPRLAPRHLLVAAVGAILAQADLESGGLGARRVGGERAGDQLVLVVDTRGDAVHRADEGALAAAHHAEADAPHELVAASGNHALLPRPFDLVLRGCASLRTSG